METKEYLSQLKLLDQRINSKIEQKRQTLELATKVTTDTTYDRVRGSSYGNKVLDCIEKLDMLEREITADIDRLVVLAA